MYTWPADRAPAFRIGRCGEDFVAEWVGSVTLRSNVDGSRVELSRETQDQRSVDCSLDRHFEALLRHLRGEISIHSSSVALDGVAISFLGDSRAGKSTIAYGLCSDDRVELVSDDICELQFEESQVNVGPGAVEHALRPDVAQMLGMEVVGRTKMRKTALRRAVQPARLAACVALVFDDSVAEPGIRRMRGAEAFPMLSRAVIRFGLDEPNILRAELDKLARVIAQAPFYEFRRSRDLSNLQACTRKIGQLLHSLAENPK